MPYISGDSIQVLSHQMQSRWNETLEWATSHQLGSRLSPLLCGLLVAGFAYGIVYLDSAVPGVNPPSPFSPRSKKRFREEKAASLHLGYLCALFCGFLVTVFMYCDLFS
ncbi:ADP-ribosylation factor-like protein 6-interacting protein 6 isoform X2 [Drosophila ficusphila]|nr:ADP-ribosylation factor-like protein 6-interacting protein 6 isoform X2 [Drosophila ficusphila]